jgi:hypothetical protein
LLCLADGPDEVHDHSLPDANSSNTQIVPLIKNRRAAWELPRRLKERR